MSSGSYTPVFAQCTAAWQGLNKRVIEAVAEVTVHELVKLHCGFVLHNVHIVLHNGTYRLTGSGQARARGGRRGDRPPAGTGHAAGRPQGREGGGAEAGPGHLTLQDHLPSIAQLGLWFEAGAVRRHPDGDT